MTAPWELPCSHPTCAHIVCPEQQSLAEQVVRLKAERDAAVDALNGYLLDQERAAEEFLLRNEAA